ncbi:MAG: prolyl oligopeptidase family serine peptidase [Gemmatimonadales bacterium]
MRPILIAGILSALALGKPARAQTQPDPPYVVELRQLMGDPSISRASVDSGIAEASSDYNYFLRLYLTGKIPGLTVALRLTALHRGVAPIAAEDAFTLESIAPLRADPDVVVKEIAYRSSVSDLGPLFAEVCYVPTGGAMPIAVVQHGGNPGSRFGTVSSCYRMARQGMFGLSVSKRGRDGSAGVTDSWAVETFDIIDAIEVVKRDFAAHVDPSNVSIWGYSGGCIDAVAAAVRFPDYFRLVAPYFGQLEWTRTWASVPKEQRRRHAAAGEQAKGNAIVDGIGGFPDEVPDQYLARDLLLGVVNNPYSRFHFFLDSEDPSGPLLQQHFKTYLEKAQALGRSNVDLHLSKPGDLYRWHHAYPGSWEELGNPDLMAAEAVYLGHVLNGDYPEPVLADAGRMMVLGYLKTKRFFVWLGEGNDAVAELDYTLTGPVSTFSFRRRSSDPEVRGRLVVPNREGRRWRAEVGGKVVAESSAAEVVVPFGLDDTVILRRVD